MITADTSVLMFFSLAAACVACAIRPTLSPEIRAMLTDGEQVRATLSVQERRSLSSGEVYSSIGQRAARLAWRMNGRLSG